MKQPNKMNRTFVISLFKLKLFFLGNLLISNWLGQIKLNRVSIV